MSINDFIIEQLVMIDALKRASAKRVIAVVPYYGYSRSDKKALSREAIAAKLVADMYEAAGVDRIMSVDLHTGQIQGFFDDPFDALTALPLLVEWVKENTSAEERVIVSPDAGRVRLTEKFAGHVGSTIAILHKRRDPEKQNVSVTLDVIGDVEGKTAILVDDMIDTAGTICGAAEAAQGARGDARSSRCATHPLFSGPAAERLADSEIEKGRGHQHPADPRRASSGRGQAGRPVDRTDHRVRAPSGLRGRVRQRDLPRRERLIPRGAPPPAIPPKTLGSAPRDPRAPAAPPPAGAVAGPPSGPVRSRPTARVHRGSSHVRRPWHRPAGHPA